MARHEAHSDDTAGHRVQIDGLRCWAVLAVIVAHTFAEDFALNRLQLGFLGVRLFFVISGFLITGILLRSRRSVELEGRGDRGGVLKSFYARRVLRIFPAYYGLVFVLSVLGLRSLIDTVGWHLLYLSNVLFAVRESWLPPLGHFWSLAVEEQFYLVWPFVILYTPRHLLLRVMVLAVVTAPLFRFALAAQTGSDIAARALTPANMDALGVGAVLAWWSMYRPESLRTLVGGLFVAGGLVVAVGLGLTLVDAAWAARVAGLDFGVSLLFGAVVATAAAGTFSGPARSLLEAPAVTYLGRVSYGMYLIHNVVPFLLQRVDVPVPGRGIERFVLVSIVTVVMASLSWRWWEQPINRQKRRFPYVPTTTKTSVATEGARRGRDGS